jgi:spore coat protein JB
MVNNNPYYQQYDMNRFNPQYNAQNTTYNPIPTNNLNNDIDKEELMRHISNANREELMRHIQELTIEKVNYNLYLDVFPEDQQAIDAFNQYSDQLKMATEEYEKLFGPITLESAYLKGVPWQWLTSPWPWEGQRRM